MKFLVGRIPRKMRRRDAKIIKLIRLGWTQDEVADVVELSQNRISEIIGNTDFGKIDKMLSEGRSMEYIAMHYAPTREIAESGDRVSWREQGGAGTIHR